MSKISIFASLLAIAPLAVGIPIATAPVYAQSIQKSNSVDESYRVSPRELISLARHGRFKAQGIPSHNNFRNSVRTGEITAEDLVTSAIANNRLPEEVTSDRNYLKAVANHLKSGGCGS